MGWRLCTKKDSYYWTFPAAQIRSSRNGRKKTPLDSQYWDIKIDHSCNGSRNKKESQNTGPELLPWFLVNPPKNHGNHRGFSIPKQETFFQLEKSTASPKVFASSPCLLQQIDVSRSHLLCLLRSKKNNRYGRWRENGSKLQMSTKSFPRFKDLSGCRTKFTFWMNVAYMICFFSNRALQYYFIHGDLLQKSSLHKLPEKHSLRTAEIPLWASFFTAMIWTKQTYTS